MNVLCICKVAFSRVIVFSRRWILPMHLQTYYWVKKTSIVVVQKKLLSVFFSLFIIFLRETARLWCVFLLIFLNKWYKSNVLKKRESKKRAIHRKRAKDLKNKIKGMNNIQQIQQQQTSIERLLTCWRENCNLRKLPALAPCLLFVKRIVQQIDRLYPPTHRYVCQELPSEHTTMNRLQNIYLHSAMHLHLFPLYFLVGGGQYSIDNRLSRRHWHQCQESVLLAERTAWNK